MDQQEKYIVSENMINYGGSFVSKLGEAIRAADPDNTRKIKYAFEDYWEKYYNDRQLIGDSDGQQNFHDQD